MAETQSNRTTTSNEEGSFRNKFLFKSTSSDDEHKKLLESSMDETHHLDMKKIRKSFRESKWKWPMLFMISSLMMGNYFCDDNPAAIEVTLEADLGITETQYSLFYSVYSYPNMILPIYGGFFIDNIGVRIGLMLFCTVTLVGQIIFCLGGFHKSYMIMLIGRFIYGFCAENFFLAKTTMVCKWFKKDLLSTAFGLGISLGCIAKSMNGYILPLIYNADKTDYLGWALFIGVCFLIYAEFLAMFICAIDKKADKTDGEVIQQRNGPVSWKTIASFNYSFWLVCGVLFLLQSATQPFIWDSSSILQTKYSISEINAGRLYTIPYVLCALFCPFLGLYIDNHGKRLYFLFGSSGLTIFAHTINILLPECGTPCFMGVIPVVLIGVAYLFVQASIWGAIPETINPQHTGTGFGVSFCFLMAASAIVPTLGSDIHDHTLNMMDGFFWQSVFWLCISIVGFIACVLLQIENTNTYNGDLNRCFSQKLSTKKRLFHEQSTMYESFSNQNGNLEQSST